MQAVCYHICSFEQESGKSQIVQMKRITHLGRGETFCLAQNLQSRQSNTTFKILLNNTFVLVEI